MKTKIFLAILLFLLGFYPAFPQWQIVHTGSGDNLVDGCFLTDSIGFAISNSGVILKTTNQGTTWNQQTMLPGIYSSICKAGTDTLYAGGNYIYRSCDRGNTWNLVRGLGDTISDMIFFGSRTGFTLVRGRYLCNWAGNEYYEDNYSVKQTADYGVNWQYKFNVGQGSSYFEKINDSVAYMFGGTFIVYPHCGEGWWNESRKTTDKGASWAGAYLPGPQACLSMFSNDTGYCVTPVYDKNHILRTTDGTNSFFTSNTVITDSSVNQCLFINEIDGYMKGNHDIFVTKSDGLIWNNDYSSSAASLNHLFYTSSHFLFAIGSDGTILRKHITESTTPDPVYGLLPGGDSVQFGVQTVNNSLVKQMTITNIGNMSLSPHILSPDPFRLSSTGSSFVNDLSLVIPPFSDTAIYIQFLPPLPQNFNGAIYFSEVHLPAVIVPVTGTGSSGVAGTLSKDTLFCTDTLQIMADAEIMNGVRVSICPGTYVKFMGKYKINVNGQLIAKGDSALPIKFGVSDVSSYWNGLIVKHPGYQDTTFLSWCDFSLRCRIFSDYSLKIDQGIVSADHCTFNNKSSGSGISVNYSNSKLILKNSRIFNTRWGIDCFSSDSTFILDNTIFNNELGITSMTDHGIVIRNNRIFNNSDGGISAKGPARIEKNKIYQNGCGVFFQGNSSADLWIGNNEVYNNYSSWAGGLFITQSGGNCSILQNLIYNNSSSSDYSGGVEIEGSSNNPLNIVISSNTICNNLSENGGTNDLHFSAYPASLTTALVFNNNIYNVWPAHNKVSWGGISPVFDFNCINQDNIPGTGNLNANPDFVLPSSFSGNSSGFGTYDWSLKISSPCINHGDTLHPGFQLPYDLADNPRVFDSQIDIGAYEYQDSVPAVTGLSGTIAHDTLICTDTLRIIGDVTISKGVRMTVCAGTCIMFHGNYRLNVEGVLKAPGDSLHRISFVLRYADTQWAGININEKNVNDTTLLTCCDLLAPCSNPSIYVTNGIINIDHCSLSNPSPGSGCIQAADTDSKLILKNSSIFNTQGFAFDCYNCSGGLIINNSIFNNSEGITGYSGVSTCEMVIHGNRIYNNLGTGISTANNMNMEIWNNKIFNNGGGIKIAGYKVSIVNNEIYNNVSTNTGGILIFQCFEGGSIVQNLIFNNAVTTANGGGINFDSPWINDGHAIYVVGNTICNNLVSQGAKGNELFAQTYSQAKILVYNNIIFNIMDSVNNIYWNNVNPMDYNCINQEPAVPGSHNIDADPLFVNPTGETGPVENIGNYNWSLKETSPCINKGDSTQNDYQLPLDFAGNPRVFDKCVDIGAYEYQGPGALSEIGSVPAVLVYPNPSKGIVNIFVNGNSPVEAIFYDVSGRKVLQKEFIRSTVINMQPFAKGFYFYELHDRNRVIGNGKIVKE